MVHATRRRGGKRGRQAEAAENDRLVLEAARTLVAAHGADLSVAAIAEEAGVGIGTLYRRYSTKEALLQHMCVVAMEQVTEVAGDALQAEDPWDGLSRYISQCVKMRTGALAPLAGAIEVTREMLQAAEGSARLTAQLVNRAHKAGVLRSDVTSLDVSLLIEVFSRETVNLDAEENSNSRGRLLALAMDGLRSLKAQPLPGEPPNVERYKQRWLNHRRVT